jgi:hypothetical protein
MPVRSVCLGPVSGRGLDPRRPIQRVEQQTHAGSEGDPPLGRHRHSRPGGAVGRGNGHCGGRPRSRFFAFWTLVQQPDGRPIDDLFRPALRAGGHEALSEFLNFLARFRRYSLFNAMLIRVQRPGALAVASRPSDTQLRHGPRCFPCTPLKKLAGAGGFDPPYGGIKIRCLTSWLRPTMDLRASTGCVAVFPAPAGVPIALPSSPAVGMAPGEQVT